MVAEDTGLVTTGLLPWALSLTVLELCRRSITYKVKVPLLIIHGKADRRTPLAGAKKYVKALKKTDIDFKHYFYKNEGHGLYFDDNSKDQYEKMQTFLNQCDARQPLNPKVAMR